MATYSYYCKDCDHHLEITMPIAQCNDPQFCVACKVPMKRLYTPPATIFKGGGWGGSK